MIIIPGNIDFEALRKDRTFFHPSFLLSLLFGGIAAWLAPDQIENADGLMQSFVSAISGLVPSLNEYASYSAFPNATRTVFAVMWAFVPWQTLHGMQDKALRKRAVSHWSQSLKMKITMVLLVIPLMLVGIWAIFNVAFESSGNCKLVCMNSSRWALWLMSAIVTIGCASTIVFVFIWIIEFPKIYLNKFYRG